MTGVIIIAIIITGAVGNCLTLFVFYRYDPLRDVTGLFLANLAVADLLQSVIGMPLIATSAFYEEWVFGEILCTISGATNSLFCITSVLTLTAVSVDRYLAIVHPLEYPTWLSMKRSKMVVVCLWLMAFFAALLPVLGWSRYVFHIECFGFFGIFYLLLQCRSRFCNLREQPVFSAQETRNLEPKKPDALADAG